MDLKLPPMLHVGIVVADMEKAAADYERLWGVETEGIVELEGTAATYRGEPITLSARYGFIRSGASEIEFIEPLSEPSPYSDFLRANGGDGIHHLAYLVDDIDPYLEHFGAEAELLLDAAMPGDGGRFVYVDGVAHGATIELIQMAA
jgi:catechol 2,3-dioxygenase-like lactoylglutathione lyase family enzyme